MQMQNRSWFVVTFDKVQRDGIWGRPDEQAHLCLHFIALMGALFAAYLNKPKWHSDCMESNNTILILYNDKFFELNWSVPSNLKETVCNQ